MLLGLYTVDYFQIPTLCINWTKTLKLNGPGLALTRNHRETKWDGEQI